MRRQTLLLIVGALLVPAVALAPARSAQPLHIDGGSAPVSDMAQPQAVLVVQYPSYHPTVTIVSLTGRQLPVPARVRNSPFGLSPDARMIAAVSGNDPGPTGRSSATARVLVGRGTRWLDEDPPPGGLRLTAARSGLCADSRSLFLAGYSGGIDRLSLTGGRTTHVLSGVPRVALLDGLVYSTRRDGSEILYLYDFATRHRDRLATSRAGIEAVLPLSRIP